MDVPRALAEAAVKVAQEIKADAILALTETGKNCEFFTKMKITDRNGRPIKLIVATPNPDAYRQLSLKGSFQCLKLAARPHDRASQAHHAIACGLQQGVIHLGERVVCLTGNGFADMSDSIICTEVNEEISLVNFLESNPVLAAAVELSLDLAKSGPDGKPLGASFVVGDVKAVLRLSRQLMINPFKSYKVSIRDRRQWDLLKKYAFFDGAFIVDDEGVVVAAQRYLDANVSVEIPPGLGTRHLAVAAITAATRAKGVTVSGENGVVRIFEKGKILAKIDPGSKIIESLGPST
ncbi:MAG: diadenylate cyclase [Candidatus Hadarchaeum sp.]|uniref:diadenylate cyclase n=1 Tax=Candidatus Hadarchaeum sp. TaxID=2883567 RepID=UPI003D0A43CC